MMKFGRESGILMHPTSLPSKFGIGELGSEAYGFVDFLESSRQRLWQILPLGPVGYGESPYQCFSAFAGNTMLISIERLIEDKLLFHEDIDALPDFDARLVEFEKVKAFKSELFRKAFNRFEAVNAGEDYNRFLEENNYWLDEFSFFMALKEYFGGAAWNLWDEEIAFRNAKMMNYYRNRLSGEIEYQRFLQYMFFSQWKLLKEYANKKGIKIIGDLPIFISYDSSDAWSQGHLFELDEEGNPAKIAGVPPDYFSETGQLWGNPHYKWNEMEKDGFKWWRDRFKLLLQMVDIIRIDHFRGFESYWEIPAGEKTAEKGRWVKAPGRKLFQTLRDCYGYMPIIVEDLGFITREVEELKNEFGFPGMKILQFTFDEPFEENSVVYTGTHDNDTTVGWYMKVKMKNPEVEDALKKYFNISGEIDEKALCWILIEAALSSKANTAIIPMQDLLCLGSEARMNIPNTIGGKNWGWRLEKRLLTPELAQKLAELSAQYGRNKKSFGEFP
jgi:4-alpha-glucanotransferase